MENSARLEKMHTLLSQKQKQTQRGQQHTFDKQQQSSLLLQPKGGQCILLTKILPPTQSIYMGTFGFDLIFYAPVNIFSAIYQDGSSCVEPVLRDY